MRRSASSPGRRGTRDVPVEKFCTGPGRTVLGRGEFLVGLRLPPPRQHSGGHYLRFIPRNEMDIAVVGVGVVGDAGRQPRPLRRRPHRPGGGGADAAAGSRGGGGAGGRRLDRRRLIDTAAALAQAAARPISDMRGDADYRRHLVGVLTKRALRSAIARAKES